MFTDPPLARVGLSEAVAQRQGVPARVAKTPTSAVLRTRTIDERKGFMKALVAADDDRILGFAMIGAEAGEVMAAVQTAMLADMPYTGTSRCHPDAPDHGGGPRCTVFESAGPGYNLKHDRRR